MADRVIEELDEAESVRLISAGGIGRIAYQSRFGPAVLPVNYQWHDGAIVFRTTRNRLFKMAPFHHHFELSKWAETTVIIRFWVLGGIAAAVGLMLFYGEYLAAIG